MTASTAWTITIVKAIASRPERERANNTTTAATASARLRADAYIDVVRLDLSDPASETTEYPRLTKALTAVIVAQTQNAADTPPTVEAPVTHPWDWGPTFPTR